MATGGGLGRGINIGNCFEAQPDHPWPLRLTPRVWDVIAAAGFDLVRLPVRWSAHADLDAPYRIDPAFAGRVDRALDEALARDLGVVLNVHHYDELCDAPAEQSERFLALWRQIADRYADRGPAVRFELLNEPRPPMTGPEWNRLLAAALAVVRATHPVRPVVVGPADSNNIEGLAGLELPDDPNLILGFHYYAPFRFTHQGAPWLEGTEPWVGTSWGTDADRAAVAEDVAVAARWAAERGRPVFVGEFGTFHRADLGARARWTRCVREEVERHGMSWAYWEFATDFGAYDLDAGAWHEPLRAALLD
jgi:endoglucanase